ncbi:GMC oxidoreductase [Panus rudis PR-1116 ss-1]|nr:GMC oxidoreductase [Panus rudis PR-1116 ss-1]
MAFANIPNFPLSKLAGTYDYVIVGGGTAGCVLANRLSQEENVSVLVLEKGGIQARNDTRVPFQSFQSMSSAENQTRLWESVPQRHVNNRTFTLAGGASFGEFTPLPSASSDHNVQVGCPSVENNLGRDRRHRSRGVDDGERMPQSRRQVFWEHTKAITSAMESMGVKPIDPTHSLRVPLNAAKVYYIGVNRQGHRSSALDVFLPPELIRRRRNRLHICTFAHVQRVVVRRDRRNVSRAEGVAVSSMVDGESPTFLIRARREVILAAGPIESAHILLLSGIGPQDHLREHDIAVVKDLPGVGSHLQARLALQMQYNVPLKDTLPKHQIPSWRFVVDFLSQIWSGQGFLYPISEVCISLQSRLLDSTARLNHGRGGAADSAGVPDLEVIPIAMGNASTRSLRPGRGIISLVAVSLSPTSTGTVRLASPDPTVDPYVDPSYLATEDDRETMRRGIQFMKQLKKRMVDHGYDIRDILTLPDSTDVLDAFIRKNCFSANACSSTCRMAREDEGGVVDDELRVYGVQGLRVADSSVFTHMPSSNLTSPTIRIAERCADFLKQTYS